LASTDRRQGRGPLLPLFDALDEGREVPGAAPTPPPTAAAGAASEAPAPLSDAPARAYAVDPSHHVVLEASAGTGKTRVLVDRYLRLLDAGVDPAHILALTFTRKAAAEMRERIIAELRRAADRSREGRVRWRALRDRLGDVRISTIDAFCLSLLKEFPLEAGLSPDFSIADETEAARLTDDAIDRAMRVARAAIEEGGDLELLFASVTVARLQEGLRHLLGRRLVAPGTLARLVHAAPPDLGVASVIEAARRRVTEALGSAPGGLDAFLASGPVHDPAFDLLARRARELAAGGLRDAGLFRGLMTQLEEYCLTRKGEPRKRSPVPGEAAYTTRAARAAHGAALVAVAPLIERARTAFARDLNVLLARGVLRVFTIAHRAYRELLREHDVVDFTEALELAGALLGQMDEFGQSRYRLESRYHHVLVDELQDTSRAQWRLIELLIRSWGEGAGLVDDLPVPPTVFVVGDRKQSIYRFRDADVGVLSDAARFIRALRPGGSPRQSISTSFRARPELLAFVNELFAEIATETRSDAFRFGPDDAFPLSPPGGPRGDGEGTLGVAVERTHEALADAVAAEIARLLESATVRDRDTGVRRRARAGDIAILFRVREGHRDYERALEARGVPTYVYKGLGFFDADEIKDATALLRFLAEPSSSLRVAAFLRSRLVRLSDGALLALADGLSDLFTSTDIPRAWPLLGGEDREVVERTRASMARWLALVDRMPPAELIDLVLAESAYFFELAGGRQPQARENLKKWRALLRRLQNRGYATLERLAGHLERLSAGDESNAVIDAVNAVNLMTVHAAKGLEFPVVFVVSLGKGAGGATPPVRVLGEDGKTSPDGAVSIEGLDTRADEEEARREREELKRLLYVALTRPRDRLYLGATINADGTLSARPGSLAEALPASLQQALASSKGIEARSAVWTSRGNLTFALRVCRATGGQANTVPGVLAGAAEAEVAGSRYGPVADLSGWRCVSVSDLVHASGGAAPGTAPRRRDRGDALVGRLVHRLFQAGFADAAPDRVTEAAPGLWRPDELVGIADWSVPTGRAVEGFLAIRAREDVRALLASGDVFYEVPFSIELSALSPHLELPPSSASGRALVRGVIDCLVMAASGDVTAVEFKTGGPAEWHRAQLAVYEAAARIIAPGARVSSRLVYLNDPARPS
jgi:ATP-dependent helicase/nuclease subunit A